MAMTMVYVRIVRVNMAHALVHVWMAVGFFTMPMQVVCVMDVSVVMLQ